METTVILASGSPRRKELLQNAGISFEIMVTDADENVGEFMSPPELVAAVSMRKAEAAVKSWLQSGRGKAVIIAADTIVHIDGKILGKPSDREEAFAFLRLLQNNWHDVYTGVTIAFADSGVEYAQDSCLTRVKFNALSDAQIEDYINTGEPFDKAGAYAIQGYGEKLVERIIGDYDNVVGLPVNRVLNMMKNPPSSV